MGERVRANTQQIATKSGGFGQGSGGIRDEHGGDDDDVIADVIGGAHMSVRGKDEAAWAVAGVGLLRARVS